MFGMIDEETERGARGRGGGSLGHLTCGVPKNRQSGRDETNRLIGPLKVLSDQNDAG